MKQRFLAILLFVLMASCSSDGENEPEISTTPTPEEEEGPGVSQGTQLFQIDFSAIESTRVPDGKFQTLEPAFALISIVDASDDAIYTRERFGLSENEGKFETDPIVLDTGTFTITEFIVLDANDVVISLVPKAGSALAVFTDTTLPFEFTVVEEQRNVTATDNIVAAGLTAIDFGYGELDLSFPENTDFFSILVDETEGFTPKILTLESVTGAVFIVDWGDGTIAEYVSNVTDSGFENTITHNYSENKEYTINVSGPVATIELLHFASDQASNFRTHTTAVAFEKLVLLKDLALFQGNLTDIDLSTHLALESLELGYNNIGDLDVTNNPKLKLLTARNNQLSTLDVSNNTELEFLFLFSNQINALDLTHNTTLFGLSVRDNLLTRIDVSNNTLLNNLDCGSNLLSTIDVRQNSNLINLNVGDNRLSTIDISQNGNLKRLDVYTNQISAIDLSSNPNLEALYIQENILSFIDLSHTPELERLIIEDNSFSSLDLSSTPKIFNLEIGGNQFDAQTLDLFIDHLHNQATTNTISDGYMDFQNNPGSDGISNASRVKINELISSYSWSFNNN
ncbi:MAG: hypothetical protein AAF717_02265 [Bacteroidota bacterium]